ncbi:MAG: hypothetical protein FJ006_12480 [Chloroflexi bacterium]|nr:hypothetical protein [Chloroflexota bacterium]
MSFTDTPSVLFGANYAFSAPNISISNVDNPSVSNAEAHATTGDLRKIAYGLLNDMYGRWNALDSANKPVRMTFTRTTATNDTAQTATVTFTLRFTTGDLAGEVADEPAA